MIKPTFGFRTWSLPNVKLRTLLLLLLFARIFNTVAQDQAQKGANCTQVLRLARTIYEQGRLHELENILSGCLQGKVGTSGGFASKQEKVDAYRFLCLSAIYLEEPTKADEAMRQILVTDPFFKPSGADPAEFKALYSSFRTEPFISFGGRVGANLNIPAITTVYPVSSSSEGNGKYLPGVNVALNGFAEKSFFTRLNNTHPLYNTLIRAELGLTPRAMGIRYSQIENFVGTGAKFVASTAETRVRSNWIDLNLIARYRYAPGSNWDPYVGIGPGFSYLLKYTITQSKLQQNTPIVEGNVVVGKATSNSFSGSDVDITPAFYRFTQSINAIWGVNTRVGQFYLNIEGRYQYGLRNLVNEKERFQPGLVADYGFGLNDFKQSNVVVLLGITYPKFKPRKKTLKKK